MIRSKKITNAARGQECTLQISLQCNGNPETVVLAHLPDETHGMGIKSSDLSACFACSRCHDILDRRVRDDDFEAHREWYMRRAMVRTWRKLFDMGVLCIK